MDPGLSDAVIKVFVALHRDGLIYRDKRLVNWDPKLMTAISDLEVEQREQTSSMWHLKYRIVGTDNAFISIATTRPETMLGDGAVAVNPEDERYQHLIGKMVILPLSNRHIPIIADDYAKMDKGSGAVKITPAHDFNDFEVGRRHNLPLINLMTATAAMESIEEIPQKYWGLDRYDARRQILEDLAAEGLVEREEVLSNVVPHGDRSGVVIEPWLMDQWYVNAEKLAAPAIKAVEDGRTKFVPERWSKTYFEWMRKTSSHGAFPDSYGGGTGSPPGMAQTIRPLSRKPKTPPLRRQQPITARPLNCAVMKMCWIHGFHLGYGRFLHLAGRRAMLR